MEKFVVDPTWSDKDSKVEKFRQLYEHNDFLTAYSMHTDLRMKADPKWAIGRGDEWESHGLLQLEFLIEQGMKPEHRLLDVGCGPGRGARRFVPYLDPDNYTGIDISQECIRHAAHLYVSEGWADRRPLFFIDADIRLDARMQFDVIWLHSVFTHLPGAQIEKMIGNAKRLLAPAGKFMFTFKKAKKPQRSGLKQFQYPFKFFIDCAAGHGLVAKELPKIWPASQRTGLITRAA